ncbi:hypothetical protein BaRGS_00028238 [Batillaria attramentaria]|uniref:SH3 domain-containing protein n=1 Tax=Batillaria attramentaria TaxID=370345 RepID=A0ABD0K086_9CAEN
MDWFIFAWLPDGQIGFLPVNVVELKKHNMENIEETSTSDSDFPPVLGVQDGAVTSTTDVVPTTSGTGPPDVSHTELKASKADTACGVTVV